MVTPMKKLFKYSKPYMPMILLGILLLFAQANAELSLPDYLSKIVNIGIQQGGIENAVPVALRTTTMDHMKIFLDGDNETMVNNAYLYVDNSSSDYAKYRAQYPILETESIYVLKTLKSAEISTLNAIIGKAILFVYGVEKAANNATLVAQLQLMTGINLSTLPPGMDIFDALALLPAPQLSLIINLMSTQFTGMEEMYLVAAASIPIRDEYQALGMDSSKIQMNYILKAGGIMLLITLLSVSCSISVGYTTAKASTGMTRDIRRELFRKVESFSSEEFDKFSTASLITRTTNDLTQIQMVVMMMLRMLFFAPLMGFGAVTRAMAKAASMWWILALAVVTLISIVVLLFSISLPKFKIVQKLTDRLNLVAREHLTGMLVIRGFNMQSYEENRFDKSNLELTAVTLFLNRLMVVLMPVMMLIMNGLSLTIIWVGAHEVASLNLQVGDIMAFIQYGFHVVFSFMMMSMMFIMLPRAVVSGDRVEEVLETEIKIKDPENPQQFPQEFKGKIEFKDVSFRYVGGEVDAIRAISFTAHPGQTTAFIGATGSGKSTVVNLIPRFYDITSGTIEIDGIDIKQVTQHELRNKIGYVPQKSSLFSGTIASNLFYADENVTEEMIQTAIDLAQAREFVAAKPEGTETPIAQGGSNVSGGQKQRLSIARAIVKRPPIYILDDSFSALDFKTDAALRKAFKKYSASSTLLIVTQRVSTIKNADQIIVLDKGTIVGKGTHAELMEKCPTYKEIALSQLTKEELA
jgi:ATP-binding cassette subfamily B protein